MSENFDAATRLTNVTEISHKLWAIIFISSFPLATQRNEDQKYFGEHLEKSGDWTHHALVRVTAISLMAWSTQPG